MTTRPGGVLLAFAKRGLFVLGLVRLSETLRVILRGFHLPQCLGGIHVLCLRSIFVAYLGVRALCCLEVVVAGYWLCHFGPRPAVGAPEFPCCFLNLIGLALPFWVSWKVVWAFLSLQALNPQIALLFFPVRLPVV